MESSFNEQLKGQLFSAVKERCANPSAVFVGRMEQEYLQLIQYGYAEKLLLLKNLKEYAKQEGIIVEVLGTINGSLVAYLLGITEFNPLEYDLFFERWDIASKNVQTAMLVVSSKSVETIKEWIQANAPVFGQDELPVYDTFEVSLRQDVCTILREQGIEYQFDERYNDEATWDAFQTGETRLFPALNDSFVQKGFFKLRVRSLERLTPLITPTVQNEFYFCYLDRLGDDRYYLPHCEIVLDKTRGYLVYQEQLLQVIKRLSDFSAARGEKIRKLMAKRKMSELSEEEYEFERAASGLTIRYNHYEVWSTLFEASDYLCCKAYYLPKAGYLYRLVYLKAHYPKQFQESYVRIEQRYRVLLKEEILSRLKEAQELIENLPDSFTMEKWQTLKHESADLFSYVDKLKTGG